MVKQQDIRLLVLKKISKFKLLITLMFFGQLIYLLVGIKFGVNIYDEGVTLYGASRILEGAIPYRDFWTLYAPGQYYVLAGLFKLFGTSIITERIWDVLARVLIAFLVFLISRKLLTTKLAIIPWCISIIWIGYLHFPAYAMYPALVFSLLAILLLLEYFARPQKPRLLMACGAAIGFATLFRHDIGAYTFLTCGPIVVAFSFANLYKEKLNQKIKLVIIKVFLPLCGGVISVLCLPTLYLVTTVPLDILFNDLIVFPLTVFHKVRSVPYPPIWPDPTKYYYSSFGNYIISTSIPFYFPAFVYLGVFSTLILQFRGILEFDKIKVWSVISITVLGLLFYLQGISRADVVHAFPTTTIATILLVYMIHQALKRFRKSLVIFFTCIILMFPFATFIFFPVSNWLINVDYLSDLDLFNCPERVGCIPIDKDEEAAANYVRSHTAKDEKIYVGLPRHDLVFINDAFFYFLANRDSATRYHELHPGVVTTLPVQLEMTNDLKLQKVNYIVLFSQFVNNREPNEGGESSNITVLDDYIRQNYQMVQQFGFYSVWKLNT